MNILVSGGAGYLGGAVTSILMNTGHDIKVYDSLLYEEVYTKNVPFVYGDIRDAKKLKKYLDWADTVIWLAAFVGDQACALNKQLAKEINTDTLQFLKDNFKKKIIFTSTCSVYGASDDLLTEKSTLNPLSHYAQTKIWAEEILKGTNSLIFRLGTLFGISDSYSRLRTDLILNTLTMNAQAKGKICVFGGKQYRPLIHVKDVARIICNCIGSKRTGIYNLHYKNTTILDLAKQIKKYFPNLDLEITNTKFEDNRNYKIESTKAEEELNFIPSITFEEGIKELKELLQANRVKNPFAERYSNYLHLKNLKGEK